MVKLVANEHIYIYVSIFAPHPSSSQKSLSYAKMPTIRSQYFKFEVSVEACGVIAPIVNNSLSKCKSNRHCRTFEHITYQPQRQVGVISMEMLTLVSELSGVELLIPSSGGTCKHSMGSRSRSPCMTLRRAWHKLNLNTEIVHT